MFASNLARSFQIFFIYLILMSRVIKICNFFNPLPANLSEGRQPPPGQGCLSDGYGSCGFCKACKNVRGVVAFRPFGLCGCQETGCGRPEGFLPDGKTLPILDQRAGDCRNSANLGISQSISSNPSCRNMAFVLEKGRLPKKPRCADRGLGWGERMM